VEATEVQYPPPPRPAKGRLPRVSLENAMQEERGASDDDDDNDAAEAAENEDRAEASEETTLSQSAESIVEGTQFQYPPPVMTTAPAAASSAWKPAGKESPESRVEGKKLRSSLPDLCALSPVHSSLFLTGSRRSEFNDAFDEETVLGIINNSPPSGGECEREEIHKPGRSADDGVGDPKLAHCKHNDNNDVNGSVPQKPREGASRGNGLSNPVKRNLSFELEPRGSRNREGSGRFTEKNLSLETQPVTNTRQKSGGTTNPALGRTINPPKATNRAESSLHNDAHEHDNVDDTEFVLTTSDIEECIKAMEYASKIMESGPSHDPFHGIDVERWQSNFKEFRKYLAALGDPSSTEAKELQQIDRRQRVFAIFDRIDANHCNVIFIYNMIRTVSGGIDSHSRGLSHDDQSRPPNRETNAMCKKLDHLAVCLDMIFGVNEDSDDQAAALSVIISKAERERSTVLKFSMTLEPSGQTDEMSWPTSQQPPAHTLPPYLHAMSRVFAQFAAENTRPLQMQLESIRKTLAATREGAMALQRQALKLQGLAQTEAEEAKARQERAEYECERRDESFKRVKEHYKAEIDKKTMELADMKEHYEREQKEAKAELARATEQRHSEQKRSGQRKRKERDGRGDGDQMKHRRTEYHYDTPHSSSNAHILAETAGTGGDKISPSIPRNIEYLASDPIDNAEEGSKERSKVSDRQSRHSSRATSTKSRSAPYELQPPRRRCASSDPKARATHRKTGQHTRKTDEHACEYGHGRQGDTKQRNALKSLPENSNPNRDANFHGTRECWFIQDEKSKKVQEASSSNRCKVTKNPYLKKSGPSKNATKGIDSDVEPSFAYQEVVRGREKRQALPGHECEECRKFHDALGPGFDRDHLVMECSRHRARHAPPSTPPDFWKLTFVDSVGSKSV